ncbi:MAG: DUF6901 family protein [bacterium]
MTEGRRGKRNVETLTIRYCFTLGNGVREQFSLTLDSKTLNLITGTRDTLPEWTKLDFHQCPNCPLSTKTHTHCPVALSLADVVERFDGILSYDQVHLEVTMKERFVSQETTAQKGISSLMGLVMATSGCPHTAFFKPMARFHLPLASEEETIYRATSTYLLAQYFLKNEGKEADFKFQGLAEIYRNMQSVNSGIARRLRAWTESDSSLNAIVLLDLYARALPMVIEDSLQEIRYLFSPFFPEEAFPPCSPKPSS